MDEFIQALWIVRVIGRAYPDWITLEAVVTRIQPVFERVARPAGNNSVRDICSKLRDGGVIVSRTGHGYKLAATPAQTSMYDVLRVVHPSLARQEGCYCFARKTCPLPPDGPHACLLCPTFTSLSATLRTGLQRVRLSKFLKA